MHIVVDARLCTAVRALCEANGDQSDKSGEQAYHRGGDVSPSKEDALAEQANITEDETGA